jgi:hypothetical protein
MAICSPLRTASARDDSSLVYGSKNFSNRSYNEDRSAACRIAEEEQRELPAVRSVCRCLQRLVERRDVVAVRLGL